jgi:branched-chain amino acid transport system ATP-binding protein
VLAVEGVSVFYGPAIALDTVSLQVPEGQIVALIGRNGAGKTTLLKTLMGLMRPRRGTITFQGKTISGLLSPQIVAGGMGLVPEGRQIFPTLTVEENLMLGGFPRHRLLRVREQYYGDRDEVVELFPWMRERLHQRGGTLSGGEQQMLAIARALMARPKLLLLDEPSLGIAPLVIKQIFETLVKLNQGGVTLLLVEQNAHLALKVSHAAYVLEEGKIVLEGPSESLRANPVVQEIYLGGASGSRAPGGRATRTRS